jgi:hypothetical protein
MIYTALLRLQHRRSLRLSLVRRGLPLSDPLIVSLEVERDRTVRRVAIDLYDRSDVFNQEILQQCDVYFKRSYYPPDLRLIPETLRNRVLPFGLNYAVRGYSVTPRLLWAIGPNRPWRLLRQQLSRTSKDDDDLSSLKQFLRLPRARDYELAPDVPAEPVVLFQTRVWEAQDVYPDNLDEVNEGRVALVRALRRAFGDRFCGGLVPTAYARRHYPDALTIQKTQRGAYIAMSKKALIGVYSRGLHHSIAFKLPEYLASSKAIVADGFRNELPVPLRDGTHYLGFHDPAECVEQCRRLLTDFDRAAAMRRATHQYYREEVEPGAHLENCLRRALS